MPATLTNGSQDFAPRLQRTNDEPSLIHAPYDNYLHHPAVYDHNTWHRTPFRVIAPTVYVPPPPPPVAHQVWILDCKSCDTFLTNRGMKAVLLLHPNISLYSSDALPINCSAYSYNPNALRPTPPRPSDIPSRTCECLTQTLCCHGCGSAVGYMIVIPCNRCTGSFTSSNRATNGHRFIFYSGEVVGTERHYVPDEPGVIPYDSFVESPALSIYQSSIRHSVDPQPPGATIAALPGSVGSDNLFRPHSSHSHASSLPETTSSDSAEVKETHLPCKLKDGDILFWHHLSRHGEISGVADDPRARRYETNTTTPPKENASYR